MGIIEDVLEACISSARAEPIRLRQGKKYYETHAQLHVMMNMPLGSDKSSMVEAIDNKKKYIYESTDYTFPGIIGSISKNGMFKKGGVVLSAGKCLWIDEHHSLNNSSRRGLLKMLEQQRYGRDLGYDLVTNIKEKRKFYEINAYGGHFEIRSRFSCLITGVFAPRKRIDDKAWLTRFMPIVFDITPDDAYEMSMGKRPFNIRVNPYKETPVFEDYEKFWEVHKETFKVLAKNNPRLGAFLGANPAFLRRDILHFCRLFSWQSRGNSIVEDWEKYVPYIPLFLYNYATNSLTLTEFQVLKDLKGGLSVREIAIKRACSSSNISNILNKIRGIGLL
jgi:hypothetical protein